MEKDEGEEELVLSGGHLSQVQVPVPVKSMAIETKKRGAKKDHMIQSPLGSIKKEEEERCFLAVCFSSGRRGRGDGFCSSE